MPALNKPSDWLPYNIKKQCRQECCTAYNNYMQNVVNPNTKAICGPSLKVRNMTKQVLDLSVMVEICILILQSNG